MVLINLAAALAIGLAVGLGCNACFPGTGFGWWHLVVGIFQNDVEGLVFISVLFSKFRLLFCGCFELMVCFPIGVRHAINSLSCLVQIK